MKFLIEAHEVFGHLVPAHDFGYSYLEVADYHNWTTQSRCDDVLFLENTQFPQECLTKDCIPVGSLDFCLAWYRQMGVYSIPPLNIPEFLEPLVKRWIFRGNFTATEGRCFGKSMITIKSDRNGWYTEYHDSEPMQFTNEVKNICSEWRLFVCNGKILGMKCYTGQAYSPPDIGYCNAVVDVVYKHGGLRAYTLDVMVLKDGVTDILELHDFFACGLYGFSDPIAIRRMAILTQEKMLGGM